MTSTTFRHGLLALVLATAGSACARQLPLAVQATKGSGPYTTSYALASLTSSPQKRSERLKSPGDYNLSNRFKVEIDGVQIPGVKQIEGLPRFEGNGSTTARFRPGRQRPGQIVLIMQGSPDSTLQAWRKSVLDGTVDRKSISIVLLSDSGAVTGRIQLSGSYPTKWIGPSLNARNSAHATEEVTIRFETFEMK